MAAALGLLALGVVLCVYPASAVLRRMTPDGQLEPNTARFLDALRFLVLLSGAVLFPAALRADLRSAARAAWSRSAGPAHSGRVGWVLVMAAAAAVLRLVVAHYSDIGLGDDGARAVWLGRWLQHPHPVWKGLWAPGHLYLQALVWLVVRDPVRAGVVLSALCAGGTVWILGRGVARVWGRAAAGCAAAGVALLPVSVAYGATPDVNLPFAFLVLASIAAAQHFQGTGKARWLVLSWSCFAFASWSRFEGFLLAPGVALMLWPRWRAALAFALACLLPTAVWYAGTALAAGGDGAASVVHAVRHDPGLHGAHISQMWSLCGGVWRGVTPPFLLLGLVGALRALHARRGREWLPILSLHGAALGLATLTAGAGTQPRYFILVGSILAAYAGVAVEAVLRQSRLAGATLLALVAGLVALTPPMFPGGRDLWVLRSARLRGVVDTVAEQQGESDVVWIAEKAAFLYPCRVRGPVEHYHALSRSDSSLEELLQELQAADSIVACVEDSDMAAGLWSRFQSLVAAEWVTQPLQSRDGYRIFRLTRIAPPTTGPSSARPGP